MLRSRTRTRTRTRTCIRIRTIAKAGAACMAALAAAYLLLIVWPQPFFAHRTVHGIYHVWSDAPIPPQIRPVLDDVTRRLRASPLHDPNRPVEIYICNAPWRMWVYGMQFSTRYGGIADVWLTRHVVIRAADIAANRIVPPGQGPIADEQHRPLSYFIAHEITHVDVSRRYGRAMNVRYPQWLMEGYPDYVGKAGDFDFDANRARFLAGEAALDPARSTLYLRYHLRVAYLLDRRHWTLDQLFDHPPAEAELDGWLRALR